MEKETLNLVGAANIEQGYYRTLVVEESTRSHQKR